MNIVIIGGVAGGASAAAKARRTNEAAEITVFEKGPLCPLRIADCPIMSVRPYLTVKSFFFKPRKSFGNGFACRSKFGTRS